MRNKIGLILFLSLFLCLKGYGQLRITVKVTDSLYKFPIERATIGLQDMKTLTDERGEIKLISSVKNPVLKVSFLGYATKTISLSLNKDTTISVKLVPTTQMVEEIKIFGTKAVLERRPDRIVYRVTEKDKNAKISDLLKKIPFVVVVNDKLIIKGRQNNQILKDGRESSISIQNMLMSNANRIDSIEVITVPSAKYDGSYENIVNIVFKKNDDFFGGNLFLGLGTRSKIIGSTFSKTTPKSNSNFGISASTDKYSSGLTRQVDFIEPTFYTLLQTVDTKNKNASLSLNYDKEFNLKKNQSLSFGGNLDYNKNKTDDDYTSIISSNTSLQFIKNFNTDKSLVVGVNGAYQKHFNKTNKLFFTNLFIYNNSRHGLISTQPLITDNKTINNEFTSRLDYEFRLFEKFQTEIGLKGLIRNYNFLPTFNDISNTNIKYHQYIFAGYLSTYRAIGNFFLRLGTRLEMTRNKFSDSKNDLFNLLSNVLASYNVDKLNNLIFSYKRTLSRPSFSVLNSFVNLETPYATNVGNPFLRNEVSDIVDLSYNLEVSRASVSLSATYEHGKDLISSQTISDNLAMRKTIYGNFAQSNSARFSYNYRTSLIPEKLDLFSSGSLARFSISGADFQSNKGFVKTVNLGFGYTPLSALSFEFFANYLDNPIALQTRYGNSIFMDMMIRYNYKKSGFKLQFTNPIVNKIVEKNSSSTRYFSSQGTTYYFGRSLSLGYNYSFGRVKDVRRKTKQINNDDIKLDKKL